MGVRPTTHHSPKHAEMLKIKMRRTKEAADKINGFIPGLRPVKVHQSEERRTTALPGGGQMSEIKMVATTGCPHSRHHAPVRLGFWTG